MPTRVAGTAFQPVPAYTVTMLVTMATLQGSGCSKHLKTFRIDEQMILGSCSSIF